MVTTRMSTVASIETKWSLKVAVDGDWSFWLFSDDFCTFSDGIGIS